jgi:outer membrane protein
LPLVPNLRIRHNDLSNSGTTMLDTHFNFGGESFAISTQVATDFSFQDTDVTLYYQVFDNEVVSFDLGLTGRWLDGEFKVRDLAGTQNASESFKGVVPMLYGALQIGVPATGLSFFGELSAVNLDDNSLQDYQAGLAYSFQERPGVGLAVRAGYREYSLELDDVDNVFADWTFDGPFLGLQAHF